MTKKRIFYNDARWVYDLNNDVGLKLKNVDPYDDIYFTYISEDDYNYIRNHPIPLCAACVDLEEKILYIKPYDLGTIQLRNIQAGIEYQCQMVNQHVVRIFDTNE